MLPLTFNNKADYDKVQPDDKVSILGLETFTPGQPLKCQLTHADGSQVQIFLFIVDKYFYSFLTNIIERLPWVVHCLLSELFN